MGTRGEDWTEAEMLRVLAYYASNSPQANKREFELLCSKLPDRTSASVNLRVGNYTARDPKKINEGKIGLKGGGSKVDAFWSRFADDKGELDLIRILRACSLVL